MQEWEKSIRDAAGAQAYFRAMGCSHFHMQRDHPERYEEYRALGIPRGTEEAWMRAEFDSKLDALARGADDRQDEWAQHSYLANLAITMRQRDALQRFVAVTRQLVSRVPPSARILVAETLVGRSCNGDDGDGILSLAQELGGPGCAQEVADLALTFCDASSAPRFGPPISERKDKVLAKLQAWRASLGPRADDQR